MYGGVCCYVLVIVGLVVGVYWFVCLVVFGICFL